MATRIFEESKRRSGTQQGLKQYQDNIVRRDAPNISAKNPFQSDNVSRDNYQTYKYDYYSGADCKIFFGDIWVDDIVTVQWTAHQSKTPIYGYASQHYNAVAKGQILVQGTLSITFKETGYLNLIQAILEGQRKDAKSAVMLKVEESRIRAEQGMSEFIPRLNDSPHGEMTTVNYSSTGQADVIRKEETIEQILTSKIISAGLSKELIKEKRASKYRDFEDFAELLEDSIWGDSNGSPFSTPLKLRRVDEFDYSPNGGIYSPRNNDDYSKSLNILLTFGDINDYRAEHTLVALNDVHFTSSSMIVSPTGDPIGETYDFIARDINKALSNEMLQNINPIKLEIPGFEGTTNLKNIDAIQAQLQKEDNQFKISVTVVASLSKDSTWNQENWYFNMTNYDITQQSELKLNQLSEESNKWTDKFNDTGNYQRQASEAADKYENALNVNLNAELFSFNTSVPFLDQVIDLVQKQFNDIKRSDTKKTNGFVNTSNSQYILETEFRKMSGEKVNSITMVLQQGVPNTMTYRVISPTRNNFAAKSIISREDLWSHVGSAEDLRLQAELQVLGDVTRKQNQLIAEKELVDKSLSTTNDELLAINDKKQKDLSKKLVDSQKEGILEPLSIVGGFFKDLRLKEQQKLTSQLAELNNIDAGDIGILDKKDRAKYVELLQEQGVLNQESHNYNTRLSGLNKVSSTLQTDITDNLREKVRQEEALVIREEDNRKRQNSRMVASEKERQEQIIKQQDTEKKIQENTKLNNTFISPNAPKYNPSDKYNETEYSKYLQQFSASAITDSLKRLDPYRKTLLDAAIKYNVDSSLIENIIIAETRGQSGQISSTGAVGLGQFTTIAVKDLVQQYPEFAKDFNIKDTKNITDQELKNAKAKLLADNALSIRAVAATIGTIKKRTKVWSQEPVDSAMIYGIYNHGKNYLDTAEGSASAANIRLIEKIQNDIRMYEQNKLR